METIVFSGTLRKDAGSKAALKQMRSEKVVPCVLYGGKENVNFSAPETAFRPLLYTPLTYVVDLSIDGKVYKALLKDTQFHPVAENLLHADFYEISESKPVVVMIPVKVTGVSEGVKAGGKLVVLKRKVAVKGLVNQIPQEIEVDVTSLGIEKTLRASDIKLADAEILETPATPIIAVRSTRASKSAEK